jgi:hypothetical protein
MEAVRLRMKGYLVHTETNYEKKEATRLESRFKHYNSTRPAGLINVTPRSCGDPVQVFLEGAGASYINNLIYFVGNGTQEMEPRTSHMLRQEFYHGAHSLPLI